MSETEMPGSGAAFELEANVPGAGAPEASPPQPGAPLRRPSLDRVIDLPVQLSVEIGRTELVLREILELGNGSVLELARYSSEPADVYVNGRLIARGDLTSLDDRLAVRIVELVDASGDEAEG